MMQAFIDWLQENKQTHPVLKAGIAQFQLVHIHPFLDGNGCTARLLSTLCLYQAGYDFKRLFSLSEYYDKNRAEYYNAMQTVRDHEMDFTPWLEYFSKGLAAQLRDFKASKAPWLQDIHPTIHDSTLSTRQKRALTHVKIHGSLSIQEFVALCPLLTKRTLQRDLSALVKNGYLISQGATNQRVYRLKDE